MNKTNQIDTVRLSYVALFEHINDMTFSKDISLVVIDTSPTKLFNNTKAKNLIILSSSAKTIHNSDYTHYKKINKKLLNGIKNTEIIISIKLNEDDTPEIIRATFQSLILLVNSKRDNIRLFNIICSNDKLNNYLIHCLNALQYSERKKQYEYIYDVVYDELDHQFARNNYCDFKNNRCIANRKKVSSKDIMGCCYSFRYSTLGKIIDKDICKYLDGQKCSTKCMACKLFTCKYLRKQGIVFHANNNILLSSFFNQKQLRVLSYNYFIPRAKIIDKLLEEDHLPYIIYYIMNKEYIPVEL